MTACPLTWPLWLQIATGLTWAWAGVFLWWYCRDDFGSDRGAWILSLPLFITFWPLVALHM